MQQGRGFLVQAGFLSWYERNTKKEGSSTRNVVQARHRFLSTIYLLKIAKKRNKKIVSFFINHILTWIHIRAYFGPGQRKNNHRLFKSLRSSIKIAKCSEHCEDDDADGVFWSFLLYRMNRAYFMVQITETSTRHFSFSMRVFPMVIE